VLRAPDDCLSCHAPSSGLTKSQGKTITVNPEAFHKSIPRDLQCVDCHAGAAKFPHTAKTASCALEPGNGENVEAVDDPAVAADKQCVN